MRGWITALLVMAALQPVESGVIVARSACADGASGARVFTVSGGHFPALTGLPEGALRAWTWRDGRRTAVPFQLDQCDADGRVIVDTPGTDSGPSTLGPRSGILFRREDAGERTASDASTAFEVEVSGRGDAPGWIYFGRDDGTLAPSVEDDVDYEAAHDRVFARQYTLGFENPQIGYFAVADGKGHDRRNLIDRLKARVDARFLWGMISFRRNEEQVKETVLGYRDGPIRVVRRARLEIQIGWGIPAPTIMADDTFYADHAEAPVTVSIPFPLGYVFGDLDVRIYLDFRDLDGFEVVAEGFDRPIRVGAHTTALPPVDRSTWFLLASRDVAFVHRLRFDPGLQAVESRLYYVGDPDRDDAPEALRGLRPAVGYRLTGWGTVARGRHEIWMDTYVLDAGAARDPAASVAALDRTLAVAVRAPAGAGPSTNDTAL